MSREGLLPLWHNTLSHNFFWGWNIQALCCKLLVAVNILKSRGDDGLIRPWDTGSMNSLVPGLVQKQIISFKALQYGHSQGCNNSSIPLLIIFNATILTCGGTGDILNITNVELSVVLRRTHVHKNIYPPPRIRSGMGRLRKISCLYFPICRYKSLVYFGWAYNYSKLVGLWYSMFAKLSNYFHQVSLVAKKSFLGFNTNSEKWVHN